MNTENPERRKSARREANRLKTEKYHHFLTDIVTHKVTLQPFEVGAHTGHISTDNQNYLHTLHKFCKKDIKLKKFKQNISAITGIASYFLFNCRNEKNWEGSDYIKPPFPNK